MNQFDQVARRQSIPMGPLTDDLALLDSGLESLGLAVVIARFEDEPGVDPFGAPWKAGGSPSRLATSSGFIQTQ
jgi:hypothetical protein